MKGTFANLFIFVFVLSHTIYRTKVLSQLEKKHEKVVVCYIGTWAVYRPGRGAFSLEDIEPDLCTHLVYSFAGLDVTSDGIRSLDAWQDLADNYGKDGYGRFVQLAKKYPKIKTTLAIGGWNEGSSNYSALAADPARRAKFVTNALAFIKKYNFDGLDLDWEFPGKRGGSPADKQNFVKLVKELYALFSKHNLLLTAAFGAGPDTIDVAYDVPTLSRYLDYIHLMCYDYHGAWDQKTGANAPLHSTDLLNVEYTVQYMIKLGAARNKLVVGIPLYGRTFTLTGDDGGHSLGSPASSQGFQGPYTRENGFMGYNEICVELKNKTANWEIQWDSLSQTPFAHSGNKVIVYDDTRSITEKVKLVSKYRLAGAMVWSLDTDDFRGDCQDDDSDTNTVKLKGFPLMHAINIALTLPPEEVDDITANEIPHGDDKDEKDAASIHNLSYISIFVYCVLFTIRIRF